MPPYQSMHTHAKWYKFQYLFYMHIEYKISLKMMSKKVAYSLKFCNNRKQFPRYKKTAKIE